MLADPGAQLRTGRCRATLATGTALATGSALAATLVTHEDVPHLARSDHGRQPLGREIGHGVREPTDRENSAAGGDQGARGLGAQGDRIQGAARPIGPDPGQEFGALLGE